MKINEIIKQRRLENNLTQEQIAERLGVTTPAVNKWEKGTCYPDITLLPALARLLGTDLNTLLSFKEDLSKEEVALFINELAEMIQKEEYQVAYDAAMEKVKEYPSCDLLLLNVASCLEGGLMFAKGIKEKKEKFEQKIEQLYQRIACSQDNEIRNQAQSILIQKFMQRKEYDKAEELLKLLPPKSWVDTEQMEVNLLIARGELQTAAQKEERKLLSATNEIHCILMTLMEIAIKENRMEDAEYIANVSKNAAKIFDLWEYHSYVAHSQLYSACKNRVQYLKILLPMLKSLTKKWDIQKSPLYCHIKTKEVDKQFGTILKKAIIQSINEDKEADFLKGSKELDEIVQELDLEE